MARVENRTGSGTGAERLHLAWVGDWRARPVLLGRGRPGRPPGRSVAGPAGALGSRGLAAGWGVLGRRRASGGGGRLRPLRREISQSVAVLGGLLARWPHLVRRDSRCVELSAALCRGGATCWGVRGMVTGPGDATAFFEHQPLALHQQNSPIG